MARAPAYRVIFTLIFAIFLFLLTPAVFGLTGPSSQRGRTMPQSHASLAGEEDQRGNFTVKLHPFVDKSSLMLSPQATERVDGFTLLEHRSAEAFTTLMEELIASYISNPLLKAKAESPAPLVDSHFSPQVAKTYRFSFAGVSLCDVSVQGFLLRNGHMAILGTIPQVDRHEGATSIDQWPLLASLDEIIRAADGDRFTEGYRVLESQRCYYPRHGEMLPSWRLVLERRDLTYALVLDASEVFALENRFFDLTTATVKGSVQAYTTNPVDGALKIFETNFVGNNTMTSTYFETNTSASSITTIPRATSDTHYFVYPPDDPRFAEASVFIHAVRMLEYFQSLGYAWKGNTPLVLRIHSLINNNPNNALYEPNRGGLPSISIGDGDGTLLKGLATDADVVSHEFGHHVIFAKLTSTSGQSLVLHEGLADFFAFSRTGDACLGEAICPVGSTLCVVASKCLRTGTNSLTYLSDDYKKLGAHQQGQIVSGTLWDLRTKFGAEKIVKIVFQAINYFTESAGFADFFTALLLADNNLYDGANACSILEAAKARGFQNEVAELDCNNRSTWVTSEGTRAVNNGGGTTAGSTSSSGSGTDARTTSATKKSSCGILAWDGESPRGPFSDGSGGLLILALVPLLIVLSLVRRS